MATLEQLLAAIEKDNRARYKTPASSHRLYSGSKTGPAPYTHTKGVVNPKTSKGSTHDGGGVLGGALGVVKHLGTDIEDTIRGLPGGVIQTVHDPIGTIKAVGSDYKRRYSPLVHGDFGKFASEVAAHPLAPLLDVASVATGGGALAAKIGQSAKVAGAIRDSAIASEVKAAGELSKSTAPARTAVTTLSKKMEKVKVDQSFAKARADNLKAPLDVQQTSAKAFEKHTNTITKIQDEIDRQSRSITVATKATNEAQKVGKLPAHIEALTKLQGITRGGFRYIGADKSSEFKGIRVAQANNPVKRLRQNLGISVQEHVIPQQTPLIGLASRAKKAANLQRDIDAGRLRSPQRKVIEAANTLEKVAGKDKALANAMAIAAQGFIDGVAPKDYARLVKDTRSTGDEIQHSIRNGKTQAEHHADTVKYAAPHLNAKTNELYQGAQQYVQREALQSGRVINPIHLQHGFNSKLVDSPEVKAIVDLQKANAEAATHAMEQLVARNMLKPDVASQQTVLHLNLVRAVKGQAPLTAEEAASRFEAAGLPAPSYNPDTLTVGDAGKRAGMLKESEGKLYARGTRRNDPMNIVMRHELASKATDLVSAHQLMLSAARKFSAGEKLPKGYVWIKDSLEPSLNQKEVLFNNQVEDGAALGEDYFKLLESDKRPAGGYAIRKDVADDLAAGRKAMSDARAETLAKGITAWKFLVLTRPAFLVHNVLSNQAMYHLKNGWNFAAFRNMRAAFKSGVFKEHHHSEGLTFSEDIIGKPKSRIAKTIGIFYKLTAQHEHWLRELTMYETARKMPEFRRELRALKGGKYDPTAHGGRTMFHEAYNRAVAKSPHIRDLVTRNMDDTLGNYRYYTQQERQLKNLSPFYGWERHSVRNIIRMMEDNPATMAMLTQIGMVGHKKFDKDFGPGMPDFVKNYVQDSYIKTLAQTLGLGDNVSMYDFNSTNPWTTALDVGKAIGGDRSAIISNLGPLVTGPLEAFTHKNALTGAPSVSRFDKRSPVLGALDRVITQTPPVTVYDALTSKKNENSSTNPTTDLGAVAKQFGLDFKNSDKNQLKNMEAFRKKRAEEENEVEHKKGYYIFVKKKKKVNSFYK